MIRRVRSMRRRRSSAHPGIPVASPVPLDDVSSLEWSILPISEPVMEEDAEMLMRDQGLLDAASAPAQELAPGVLLRQDTLRNVLPSAGDPPANETGVSAMDHPDDRMQTYFSALHTNFAYPDLSSSDGSARTNVRATKADFDFDATSDVHRGPQQFKPEALKKGSLCHPFALLPKESYRVTRGKAHLLAVLLETVSAGQIKFEIGMFKVRAAAGPDGIPIRDVLRDATKPGLPLRFADTSAFPVLINDYYSAACLLAQANGGLRYHSDTGLVDLQEPQTIVLNWKCRGVARAANCAYLLYEREEFPRITSDLRNHDSPLVEFAKRLLDVLRVATSTPAVCPLGLGGAFGSEADYLPRYPHPYMVASVYQRTDDVYEIVSDPPRFELESIVSIEARIEPDPIEPDPLDKSNDELMLYSPVMRRMVMGGTLPRLAENPALAISMLLQTPVVIDRSGVFVDPEVRVRILDPLPALQGSVEEMRGVADTWRYAKALNVKSAKSAFTFGAQSGFNDLMASTARDLLEEASFSRSSTLLVVWDGFVDSTAILAAFIDLGPSAFRQNRVTLRVCFPDEAIMGEAGAYHEAWLKDVPEHWEGVLDPCPANGIHISQLIDLENCVVVTASHSNHIFGSPSWRGAFSTQAEILMLGPVSKGQMGADLSKPWGPIMTTFCKRSGLFRDDPEVQGFMDLLDRLARAAPFELVTIRDLLWWLDFTLQWQNDCLRELTQIHGLNAFMVMNLRSFFRGEAWQQWSMNPFHHAHLKFPDTRRPETYKMLLKGYVLCSAFGRLVPQSSRRSLWMTTGDATRHPPAKASSPALAIDSSCGLLTAGLSSMRPADLVERFGENTLKRFLN